jgi:hypothetical protein
LKYISFKSACYEKYTDFASFYDKLIKNITSSNISNADMGLRRAVAQIIFQLKDYLKPQGTQIKILIYLLNFLLIMIDI